MYISIPLWLQNHNKCNFLLLFLQIAYSLDMQKYITSFIPSALFLQEVVEQIMEFYDPTPF